MEGQPLPNPVHNLVKKKPPKGRSAYVEGNFFPVFKETKAEAEVVEGQLPRDLKGQFMRIGPNPRFDTIDHFYHPFDGDGMVHCIDFSDDKAVYSNKWIQTKKMQKALERGFDVFGFGELTAGIFENQHLMSDENGDGMGTANTNIIQHVGRTYALYESDKPYEFNKLDLSTIGKATFNGQLVHNVAAHPKVDFKTNEFILFGYSIASPEPHVSYSVFNKDRTLVNSMKVPIPGPRLMHDMVITEQYSLLFDPNFEFDAEKAFSGRNPWVHHTEKNARFGIFKRHCTDPSQVKWVEIQPCGLFHFANAWEEGDKIYIYGCRSDRMDVDNLRDTPATKMYEWIISSETWTCVSERKVSDHVCDFPQVDQMKQGYKTRYLYAVEFKLDSKSAFPQFGAILKYDTLNHHVTRFTEGLSYSEAVFAPKISRTEHDDDEDNGFIISFAHDETKNESSCSILNARDMKLACKLRIPRRVPHGFHASYIHPSEMLSKL